jgi:hypothetical protein
MHASLENETDTTADATPRPFTVRKTVNAMALRPLEKIHGGLRALRCVKNPVLE